ncbi:MAG: hypothetical protein R3C97_02820 [Geminicoccaceae bacterium]
MSCRRRWNELPGTGEATLRHIGTEDDRIAELVALLRSDDYATLRHLESRQD